MSTRGASSIGADQERDEEKEVCARLQTFSILSPAKSEDNTRETCRALSTPAFGASSTLSWGESSMPSSGTSSTPTFSAFSMQASKCIQHARFQCMTAAFGTSSAPAFVVASSPSFSLQSTLAFGQPGSTFGTIAFGTSPFGNSSSPFGAQSSPVGVQTMTPTFGSRRKGDCISAFSSPATVSGTVDRLGPKKVRRQRTEKREYNCNLCGVTAIAGYHWLFHVNGKRHQKALKRFQVETIKMVSSDVVNTDTPGIGLMAAKMESVGGELMPKPTFLSKDKVILSNEGEIHSQVNKEVWQELGMGCYKGRKYLNLGYQGTRGRRRQSPYYRFKKKHWRWVREVQDTRIEIEEGKLIPEPTLSEDKVKLSNEE